jgi:hypothetical protein
MRKGSWAAEKQALCWNPQGKCRRGRPMKEQEKNRGGKLNSV